MVALAVRALVFAGLAWVAGGSGGGHSVLVEEFLECGQGLHLEFDEVIQLLLFWALMALTSSAVVSRMRLAVSLVKGVMVSMWFAQH